MSDFVFNILFKSFTSHSVFCVWISVFLPQIIKRLLLLEFTEYFEKYLQEVNSLLNSCIPIIQKSFELMYNSLSTAQTRNILIFNPNKIN